MTHPRPKSIALVDLSALFKLRFHGGPQEEAGHRVLGDLAAIRSSVAHVVLCLDAPPYVRKDIFRGYKANRTPPDPAERYQKQWLFERCEAGGYQMARCQGHEGDDVIATLARIYGEWCPEVLLVGSDKDLAACVTSNVVQFVPGSGPDRPSETRGPAEVKQKYGVTPEQIPLFLALVGDKSDNIPGVKDIGQIKAATLLAEFKTYAALKDAVIRKNPAIPHRVYQALAAGWDQLELSFALTRLVDTLPLDAEALLLPREPVVPSGAGFPEPDGVDARREPIIGADPNAESILREAAARREERALEEQERAFERALEAMPPVEPQPLGPSVVEQLASAARERIANGLVDETGRESPDGPRKSLTPAQQAMFDAEAREKARAGTPANDGEAEFDPISRAPGATGPLPPLPPSPAPAKETALAKKGIVDYGLVTDDLQPRDLRAARLISEWLFASGLYQKFPNATAIFAVVLRGKELGLGVTTSLSGFHVIEGRPSASADLIRALAERDPNCEYLMCVESDDTHAVWETKHRSHPRARQYKYTIEQARRAGMTGGNWEKRPMEMLSKTAASKLAREVYPGAVQGLYCPEELDAINTVGEAA